MVTRVTDRANAVRRPGLGEYLVDVQLAGVAAQKERARDVAVGKPVTDQHAGKRWTLKLAVLFRGFRRFIRSTRRSGAGSIALFKN
jgi:hypothetical protein